MDKVKLFMGIAIAVISILLVLAVIFSPFDFKKPCDRTISTRVFYQANKLNATKIIVKPLYSLVCTNSSDVGTFVIMKESYYEEKCQ